MFYLTLWIILLWMMVNSNFNIYDTDRPSINEHLQFDCLYYHMVDLPHKNNFLWGYNTYTIEYCCRPLHRDRLLIEEFLNTRDRNFTFYDLYRMNVTEKDLFSWSAPIDLIEEYEQYRTQYNISSPSNKLIFFNCTKPWFGSHCQYAFKYENMKSLYSVVNQIFSDKNEHIIYTKPLSRTCYTHLACDRGGSQMCLDWREICNGRIDCIDGGQDEANCLALEVNQCNDNEYRCLSGFCVPRSWQIDEYRSICFDRSNPLKRLGEIEETDCADRPTFKCEEQMCRLGRESFSCGDGQCIQDVEYCRNGRHILLYQSIIDQGNLSYNCWIAIACFTKTISMYDFIETSCEEFFQKFDLIAYLNTCESLTQYPNIPVLFGHVYFLYNTTKVNNLDLRIALTPDYVCYHEQLCDFLVPTFQYENLTCQSSFQVGIQVNKDYYSWHEIIGSIKPSFRGCLTRFPKDNDTEHSSLYCCKNSSKCISKQRIIDGISDCYLNDDEEDFNLSCSLKDVVRYKCPDENKCRSSSFLGNDCLNLPRNTLNTMFFYRICDGIIDALPEMIDGMNYTDETECEHWPCNNIYTRCDLFWQCPKGEDEETCTKSICPRYSLPCITMDNYTFVCLPAHRVNDGKIDCLGASDELYHCRDKWKAWQFVNWFRCFNDTECIRSIFICDGIKNCPYGDDEVFCEGRKRLCHGSQLTNQNNYQMALCRYGGDSKVPYSFESLRIYPLSFVNTTFEDEDQRSFRQQYEIANDDRTNLDMPEWLWNCNQGLYVRNWLGGNNYGNEYFCPPNYYGDLCQYQSQRVSLTMKIASVFRHRMYAIVVMLIEENDHDDKFQQVNSYHELSFIDTGFCSIYTDTYLLYAKRPKNDSNNYYVRIDVFDKRSLAYVASWHFDVLFLFLPVNRIVNLMIIPVAPVSPIENCSLACYHGQCMKYSNKEKSFCRCTRNWHGINCHIPVNPNDCSSDAISIGINNNHSICVCPMNKVGPRCFLRRSCPPNFCKNNGECVTTHENIDDSSYSCICPEQFSGPKCELKKHRMTISVTNMKISSYLLIYIISHQAEPNQHIMLQKLGRSHETITFSIKQPYHAIFVKNMNTIYLAVSVPMRTFQISTSISSAQECRSINDLFNSTLLKLPQFRRIKYYHIPCQLHRHLMCFYDETDMCLCTLEYHANCFKFNQSMNLPCQHSSYCENGAQCLQNDEICPSTTVCICIDCYFGDRCQYYAKGIGLTIDDILRYEIRSDSPLISQPLPIKLSAIITMIMFVLGLINSIFSFLVFQTKDSCKVGCGLYLLTSSITSLLTVITFTFKYWFFILTQMKGAMISRSLLRGGCVSIETALKLFLYTDNWLNACVAIERSVAVFQQVSFNKPKSKQIAKGVIIILPFAIIITIIHEPIYRELVDDLEEHYIWCVTRYSSFLQGYNTFILFFHFLAPILINFISTVFIIVRTTRHRAAAQTKKSYKQHLREQLREHQQRIISPSALVLLSLPRILISLVSSCVKATRSPWLYLSAYFISFIPSILIFIIFVLSSELYMGQFKIVMKRFKKRTNQT